MIKVWLLDNINLFYLLTHNLFDCAKLLVGKAQKLVHVSFWFVLNLKEHFLQQPVLHYEQTLD
jgi:hypothetical protein